MLEGVFFFMCLNPLRGFQIGFNPSGKPDYKIVSGSSDYLYYLNSSWHPGYFYPGTQLPQIKGEKIIKDFIQIPCGHCIECRLAYSRQWASRMMLEAKDHEQNYFVTLTYDPEYVPISYYPDPDSGEAFPALSLRKADVSSFMKRLRRRLEYAGFPPIRFYCAGEYGESTHRPHYHAIIFGLQLDDLELLHKSATGFPMYTSRLISECWSFGFSSICAVSWESCAYVSRYCTKKMMGDCKDFYSIYNIEPEFALMSRRPGIARKYFDEHKDEIYEHDEIFLDLPDGGKRIRPMAYFDNLYDLEHPDLLAEIKDRRRRFAESADEHRQRQTTLSPEEQLAARKRLLDHRNQLLRRTGL